MEKVSHFYLNICLELHIYLKPNFCQSLYTSLSQKSNQFPLNILAVLLGHMDWKWNKANSNYYSYGIDKSETGIKEAQGNQLFKLDKTNLRLLCKQLQDHPLTLVTNQNQRLYTWGYCWPRYYGLPGHGAHSPCLRGTSCQMQSPAACQPAGWLWSGHHASASKDASSKSTAISH